MANPPRFNYIITIHNKEDMIEKVLMAVLMCCRDDSHIYPVLDGCTDNTEAIIDDISQRFNSVPITKVYTSDVHELLSINAGLKAASHEGEGYNIVLQDDVVLQDFLLERKVEALYAWGGPKLGYVSFRLGVQFAPNAADSTESVPLIDYCENAYGHGLTDAEVLLPGQFAYRDIPIKSPVCFPFKLIREIGMLEEKLAPYAHDDVDYAIRCINAGYYNGVCSIKFESKIEWGGTRQKVHPRMAKIIAHNMDQIRGWFHDDIKRIGKRPKKLDIITVPGMATEQEVMAAQQAWENNKAQFEEFQKHDMRPIEKLGSSAKKTLKKVGSNAGRLAGAPKVLAKVASSSVSKQWQRRHQQEFMADLSFSQAVEKFPTRNALHQYMHHYFYHFLPKEIREHRLYFSQNLRGFGEDAFQAMWWTLLREYQPKKCLEIGVYRGQIISLWALIAKLAGYKSEIHGISPFTPAGDTVSVYLESVDYLQDVHQSFELLQLPAPKLLKAFSNDDEATAYISASKWDLVYIDGNHDYDVVLSDYKLCKANLAPKGILVFDDSSLYTDYSPPSFSTAGHPGPSKVVQEFAHKEMKFLGAVGHNSVFQKK